MGLDVCAATRAELRIGDSNILVGQGLRESHADGEHDPEAAVVHRTLGKQRESAKSRQRDQHFRQQDRLVAGSGALP
jgi:hypothetical protein